MKLISLKPIIHGLIATALMSSHTWAMEENPREQDLATSQPQMIEITIERQTHTLESNTRFLNISSKHLTTLPAVIFNFTALKALNLSDNHLTSLPAEIGKLTNLTMLNLNNNQLTTLPAEMGNMTALTTLALAENNLTSLPAEMGNLTNLTELELSDNYLTTLPAEMGNLTNLTSLILGRVMMLPLHLCGNQLKSLPAEMGNMTALTTLDLGENPLAGIESKWAKYLYGPAQLIEFRLFYTTKEDVMIKSILLILANIHDKDSPFNKYNCPYDIIKSICKMHIKDRLG